MKLIAEQIKILRDKKQKLENKKLEYLNYLETMEKTGYDNLSIPQCGSYYNDMEYCHAFQELEDIENVLNNATFITERNLNQIDIGTAFYIQFADEEDIERYVLVDENTPSDSFRFISLSSDLGKAIYGKTEGDDVTYKVNATGREMTVSIKDIDQIKKNYTHFIREKCLSNRISNKSAVELGHLKKNNKNEYDRRHFITKSQKSLAEEEIKKYICKKDLSSLAKVRNLTKIINTPIAELRDDNKIGIGSHVKLLLQDEKGNIEEKDFEYINQAFSTEIEDQYVERITPLGEAIYGLSPMDKFTVRRNHQASLKGTIVFVDNNYEDVKKRVR